MRDTTLDYNTEREKLQMPEYGRNVLKMVEQLKTIEDIKKRTEQARAVIKSMEILNPSVRQQDDYEHKLWDHLYLIAGPDFEVDSPYPAPMMEMLSSAPEPIALNSNPVKARHYGRNIERIIDLIAQEQDSEVKTAMIRSLAIYMRQQYLIWNKDSVADETIFSDIEKLSDHRITVPEGLTLSRISFDANFSRPGLTPNMGGQSASQSSGKGGRPHGNRRRYKKK